MVLGKSGEHSQQVYDLLYDLSVIDLMYSFLIGLLVEFAGH
jgi:hypothetical protein